MAQHYNIANICCIGGLKLVFTFVIEYGLYDRQNRKTEVLWCLLFMEMIFSRIVYVTEL